MGVSSIPVREALLDLAGSGLVEIIRNKGLRIPALRDSGLAELLEWRMLLERPAVVRVAKKNTALLLFAWVMSGREGAGIGR